MSDVRLLLRQQQAARRINHSLAIYTDTGKLTCVLCDELIIAESLWDIHLRSKGHYSRVQNSSTLLRPSSGQKRSLESTTKAYDEPITDGATADDIEMEQRSPKKRTRPNALDINSTDTLNTRPQLASMRGPASFVPRRLSGAPPLGIEITIATRPATPSRIKMTSSVSSTFDSSMITTATATKASEPEALSYTANSVPPDMPMITDTAMNQTISTDHVDEDEWAMFEADIAITTSTYENATVSAAAKTQEDIAIAEADTENENNTPDDFQKESASKQIQDEKEEATRKLEAEFEDMEELEAQVRLLKEKREALRKHNEAALKASVSQPLDQDNDTHDEESGEEEDDDWAGFRFKGTIN